jgi:2,4-dichlorophenol 6-monooxygenase
MHHVPFAMEVHVPDEHDNVPVLIVGGGPAGLSASLLLSRLGIRSLLVERREGTSDLPKAQHLNLRTMEIFDVCGVADEIYERGSPMEFMRRVAWWTSLTGPTDLHGREIAARDCWGGGADAAMSALASRYRSVNLSQLRLEPLLKRYAEKRETAVVRFGHELLDLTQDDDGVTATILDRSTEAPYQVRSQYLVGADGGRTVGNLIGAVLEGKRDLVKMVSTHMQVDLRRFDLDPAICIHWFINPDHGGSIGSGVLVKMGGPGWGPNADEWVFGFATTPDDPQEFDSDYVIERFRRAVGDHSLEVKTYRVSPWRVESLVADRYSSGRVFLAGDAAHRHPPTGALGMNAAVHDVHNLTWKLALVLRGLAGPSLLDSYQAERKPVAQLIVDQALSSFFQHSEIDHAIGLDPQSPEAGWAGMRELFSDTPAGRDKRAAVDAAAERKGLEFSALNLEIGYRYREGAVVADPEPDDTRFDARTFVPSARAGARMPHAWVGDGINRRSTYDLVTPGRFTLFVGDDGDAWRAAVDELRETRELPLDVIAIGERSGLPDAVGAWREQSGVLSAGAVLVRPDHHVAWSTAGAVSDPGVTMREVFDVVLPADPASVASGRLG